VPTVVVGIPVTAPTETAPVPTVDAGVPLPTPTATPIVPVLPLASGGLGLTLEEWVAVYGQPDALVDGLQVFDEADRTYSLQVVNGRIAIIFVAWKPGTRPDLAMAQ